MGYKNLIFRIIVFFPLKHDFKMFLVNKFHDNSFHCIGRVSSKRKSITVFNIHRWYWYPSLYKFLWHFLQDLDLGFDLKSQIFQHSYEGQIVHFLIIVFQDFQDYPIFQKIVHIFYDRQFTGESFICTHKALNISREIRNFII